MLKLPVYISVVYNVLIMKRQARSEELACEIERWHKILAPKFPDIDPHDLDLIIAGQLRTPKERMQLMFLKKRKDGSYFF